MPGTDRKDVSVITLTTDFGSGSPYVAAMKGVILSVNPTATLVDVTHQIRPQDVHQGALVLDDVTGRFPAGTIHVAVVDPGVGTQRAIVYARIGEHHFVAPDNGLLWRLARRTGPSMLIQVTEPQYWLHPVSSTFHGRDIMAPVAARLSLGLEPRKLGPPLESLVSLDWPEPVVSVGKIEGQILDVDLFGNLISNVDAEMLAGIPEDGSPQVAFGNRKLKGIDRTYGQRPSGSLVALIGSTGRLELAVVNGNAAEMLNARIGDPVTVQWDAKVG